MYKAAGLPWPALGEGEDDMKRATLSLIAMMLTMLLLASGVALAVTKVGGPGNDFLTGTDSHDSLNGEGGDDLIAGLGADDYLAGGLGDDSVSGGAGDDVMVGQSARFREPGGRRLFVTIHGGPSKPPGDDTLSGGSGGDFILDEAVVEGGVGSSYFASCDERSSGAPGDLQPTDTSRDTLSGGGSCDTLFSFSGPDTISGGAGDDIIKASSNTAANVISGGDGNDNIDARGVVAPGGGEKDIISCGGGKDEVLADQRDQVGPDCENVRRV